MFKNYLKVALRNLSKHRLNAAISIFSLALGLACCILVMLFVRHELSFDRFHEHADALYRVKSRYQTSTFSNTPAPLVPSLVDRLPDVVAGTRLWEDDVVLRRGTDVFNEKLTYADPSFFDVFTFPLTEGIASTALSAPQSVVLSADAARTYFGDVDPLGKTLTLVVQNQPFDFTVTGVARPIPSASTIHFGLLTSFDSIYLTKPRPSAPHWMRYSYESYVQLREGVAGSDVTSQLPQFVDDAMGDAIRDGGDDVSDFGFSLVPMASLHWSASAGQARSNVLVLSLIALAVLLIACFNFMNLSIGQASGRLREIGMRKVLGAARRQLVRQFWMESMLYAFIATLLGIMLSEILLPLFNGLAQVKLTLHYADDAGFLLLVAGLTLITGFVSGSYPALLLSSFRTTALFDDTYRIGRNTLLTRSLVVVQFALSIALIITTLVMRTQHDFMTHYDLGFDKEHVVVVDTQGEDEADGREVASFFKQALERKAQVQAVSVASRSFTRGSTVQFMPPAPSGEQRYILQYQVDDDYVPLLGLTLVSGRNFSRDATEDQTRSIIVNETFLRTFADAYELGDDPIGAVLPEEIAGIASPRIIGVVKDYHVLDLHSTFKPVVLKSGMGDTPHAVLVRTQAGKTAEVVPQLETLWKEIRPNKPFQYHFLDDDVDQQYRTEVRWTRAVRAASIFAVLIACMGLFGFTTLTVTRRTKEIGIRKVVGAGSLQIISMLNREFALLVAIAAVLATPVAYYATHRWLEDFAVRIDTPWTLFILTGLGVLTIALATVSYLSFRAAWTDPVKALRYE